MGVLNDCISKAEDKCAAAKAAAPDAKTWMNNCCDKAFDKMDKDDEDKLAKDKKTCNDRVASDFDDGFKAAFCKETKPALEELNIKSAARKTMHVAVWTIVIIVVVSCLCVVGIIYGIYALCCKQADGREVYVAMDAPLVE